MSSDKNAVNLQDLVDKSDRAWNNGEYTFSSLTQKSLYKFCNQCGHFGRRQGLIDFHIPKVHKHLPVEQLGFLKVGEVPKEGLEQVQMTLRLIGSNTPAPSLPENSEKKGMERSDLENAQMQSALEKDPQSPTSSQDQRSITSRSLRSRSRSQSQEVNRVVVVPQPQDHRLHTTQENINSLFCAEKNKSHVISKNSSDQMHLTKKSLKRNLKHTQPACQTEQGHIAEDDQSNSQILKRQKLDEKRTPAFGKSEEIELDIFDNPLKKKDSENLSASQTSYAKAKSPPKEVQQKKVKTRNIGINCEKKHFKSKDVQVKIVTDMRTKQCQTAQMAKSKLKNAQTNTDQNNSKNKEAQTSPKKEELPSVQPESAQDWRPSQNLMDDIFKARLKQKWEDYPRDRLAQAEEKLQEYKDWIVPLRQRIDLALQDIEGQLGLNYQLARLTDLYTKQKRKMEAQEFVNKRIIRTQRQEIEDLHRAQGDSEWRSKYYGILSTESQRTLDKFARDGCSYVSTPSPAPKSPKHTSAEAGLLVERANQLGNIPAKKRLDFLLIDLEEGNPELKESKLNKEDYIRIDVAQEETPEEDDDAQKEQAHQGEQEEQGE